MEKIKNKGEFEKMDGKVGVQHKELIDSLESVLKNLDASKYIKDGQLLVHNLIVDLQENGDIPTELFNTLKQKIG